MPLNYLCSLPNKRSAGRIPQIITDDPEAIAAFTHKWDIPGRGVFRCVSTLKPGATRRALDTVDELAFVHVDVDLRTLRESRNQVLKQLRQWPIQPQIRDSGGGFHVALLLKEPVVAGTAEAKRVDDLRTRLTAVLCGDAMPNHAAALLREVGTSNTKYGEPRLVRVIQAGELVDITDVEDLLDLLGDAPLFTSAERATNGHDHAEGEPRPSETKQPVDAEARLAAMKFQGAGDRGVHITQLQSTASLLRSGIPVEDVVAEVLKATRRAVASDPAWNWDDEKLTIERMCYDFVSKNPELAPLLPDKLFAAWNDRLAEGRTQLRIVYARHLKWHIRSQESKAESAGSANDSATAGSPPGAGAHAQKPRGWNFYDSTEITPQRWCVKKLLPETGVGILSGQWGSFKTTVALEMSVAVMTGQPFANQYKVKRPGAVLYIATEGAGTLQSRLAAIARYRGAPERLPFAWRSDCPLLTDKGAGHVLARYIDDAAAHFSRTYQLPISLIWVDTYITAAGLGSGDDNDSAATQKAFNTLRFIANHGRAFVCTVDHYGKVVESGTRGSSGKEGNADTVLATLAERELAGTISQTRMAARKQRDGASGFETPFRPETVELGLDEDGDPITAIVLDWGKQQQGRPPSSRRKSRDADLLAKALADVVAKHGFPFQPAQGAPTVQACHAEDVQKEFYSRRPAKGTGTQQRQTRWVAYNRGLAVLSERGLIGTQETNGSIILWKR